MVLKLYPTTLATSTLIISYSQMLKFSNEPKKCEIAWDAYKNAHNMYR